MKVSAGQKDRAGAGAAPQYPIESVDNALRLILLFRERDEVRLKDVSSYLSVASSTAHRLLAMLQYRGYVEHDPVTKIYRPGPSLLDLGAAILARTSVVERLRPLLERLNQELKETIHVGVLEGISVRYVDAIESPRAVRVASRAGRAMPAHCISSGKVLLARLPEADLRRLYPEERLEQLTDRTLASRSELEAELAKVRSVGLAQCRDESEAGLSSVAIAITLPGVPTPFALSVAAPTMRLSSSAVRTIRAALISVARDLESRSAGATAHGAPSGDTGDHAAA